MLERVFKDGWPSGGDETPCGIGSKLSSTEDIRNGLVHTIKEFDIKSINDAGCGDFN